MSYWGIVGLKKPFEIQSSNKKVYILLFLFSLSFLTLHRIKGLKNDLIILKKVSKIDKKNENTKGKARPEKYNKRNIILII